MEMVQVEFRSRTGQLAERAADALQECLAAWVKNGQVSNASIPIAQRRDGYLASVMLPEAAALHARFANVWVRRAMAGLKATGFARPVVTRLGPVPDGLPACRCRQRPFLILFTALLREESPVRCGGCFRPVPLYRLPITDDEGGNYQDVLGWAETYQAMDRLFIGSGAGERFAHAQLSQHDSALSVEGRTVARRIEATSGLPVYYNLFKHWGRSDPAERRRRCPSCGKAWLRAAPLHDLFDFQCTRCRLVSNVAFDVRTAGPV